MRTVLAADLEHQLDRARAGAAGPAEGLLGPDSITWRIDREAIVFLGAGRALLLQLAHPWVGAGVSEHSQAFADPIGRFHRTFGIVLTMIFGTLDQALDAARRLHRRHAAVGGTLPDDAGPFPAGSAYWANEVAALQWVHATLIDSALVAYELIFPPLKAAERERYYAESRLVGALFGIPSEAQPADWDAFAAYMAAMTRSDALAASPSARRVADQVFAGAGRWWLRTPGWYRAVTADLLPARLRAPFGLSVGEADRRRAEHVLRLIRRSYPLLPLRARTAGPYQEAIGRITGRAGPDALTRCLNRVWIGRPSIAVRG